MKKIKKEAVSVQAISIEMGWDEKSSAGKAHAFPKKEEKNNMEKRKVLIMAPNRQKPGPFEEFWLSHFSHPWILDPWDPGFLDLSTVPGQKKGGKISLSPCGTGKNNLKGNPERRGMPLV
jgi:hypothetical protein